MTHPITLTKTFLSELDSIALSKETQDTLKAKWWTEELANYDSDTHQGVVSKMGLSDIDKEILPYVISAILEACDKTLTTYQYAGRRPPIQTLLEGQVFPMLHDLVSPPNLQVIDDVTRTPRELIFNYIHLNVESEQKKIKPPTLYQSGLRFFKENSDEIIVVGTLALLAAGTAMALKR